MRLERLLLLSLLLVTVASCSPWRPPPRAPLRDWREAPPGREGIEEWVRDTAIIQILPVQPVTPNEYATLFDDAASTAAYINAEIGSDEASGVEVIPVRRHGAITWVDATFDMTGARRRARVAWFAEDEGSRVLRLIAPKEDWSSRDVTTFMDEVRDRATQVRLSD